MKRANYSAWAKKTEKDLKQTDRNLSRMSDMRDRAEDSGEPLPAEYHELREDNYLNIARKSRVLGRVYLIAGRKKDSSLAYERSAKAYYESGRLIQAAEMYKKAGLVEKSREVALELKKMIRRRTREMDDGVSLENGDKPSMSLLEQQVASVLIVLVGLFLIFVLDKASTTGFAVVLPESVNIAATGFLGVALFLFLVVYGLVLLNQKRVRK
jgi:hypothetical protein